MSSDNNACPHLAKKAPSTRPPQQNWWPNQLNLKILHRTNANNPSPTGFDYTEEFLSLDLESVKNDIHNLLTTSQPWWPSDYNHYGPFMIRMAWHSAGTYRIFDGRGGANTGNLRFAPLNSWPDNANLDKAKRLLWPIKQKYGKKISWADLMILTGNCALESMGFVPFGFAGGREDIYAPEEDVYWGPERKWLDDSRRDNNAKRDIEKPLGAVQMGLIYVNPEGPGGNSDPLAAAMDIRETFARMAMNDEETVALVAGGHTFGKAHGAADADKHVGPEPEGARLQEMGLGWTSNFKSGKGADTITSGLEGAWTANPILWDNGYFENLFQYEWKQSKSPGGATQWIPTEPSTNHMVPDAHLPNKKHPPIMFTTDLALIMDPIYAPISRRFYENPEQFRDAFAKAWYKLTHRDMGPIARCLGNDVPAPQLWQDPIPNVTHELINEEDANDLKDQILNSGLTIPQLVRTAWASASTYRATDHRGGANGARVRLSPQKQWAVNDPQEMQKVIQTFDAIRTSFNNKHTHPNTIGKQISLADLIVLGGAAAIEESAKRAGFNVTVPFTPGRTDAVQNQTDVESFAVLEPTADGFRNYFRPTATENAGRSEEECLLDRAHMLTLTAPEMTVLVGGMRVLNANTSHSQLGVFTKRKEVLTNDFFVNLLDMSTVWKPSSTSGDHEFLGCCCHTGDVKWVGSRIDLVFGSNSELRALAEYYACDDSKEAFVNEFVAAWAKVMNLDRFDLKKSKHETVRNMNTASSMRSRL